MRVTPDMLSSNIVERENELIINRDFWVTNFETKSGWEQMRAAAVADEIPHVGDRHPCEKFNSFLAVEKTTTMEENGIVLVRVTYKEPK